MLGPMEIRWGGSSWSGPRMGPVPEPAGSSPVLSHEEGGERRLTDTFSVDKYSTPNAGQ